VTIFGNHGFEMKAAKMAVCTNGFAKKLLPLLKDISPARNQVLITKPIENLHLKGTFHYDRGYVYFRNVGNRVLLGGFRQLAKTEETTAQFGLTNNIQDALESFLRTVILPNQKVEIEQWWSGIMGVGETKAPIVKEVEKNVFVAVRLGGMGVAIGSLVGEEVAELMNG
jgi:glycine/D-amino acid oxidase-like deaminating enzyme